LTVQENSERTAGGLVGRITGKAKQAAGSLLGNSELAREGRLQQAQVDAEDNARHQKNAAEQLREAKESAALSAEQRAERDRIDAAGEAIRLEQQARSRRRDGRIPTPRRTDERPKDSQNRSRELPEARAPAA
jgi:uncharacterized protein YjbJ (UPF0337 family)